MMINNVSIIVIIKNIFKDLFDTIKYFVHHPTDCCHGNIFMYVILYVLSVYICELCVNEYFMVSAHKYVFTNILSWIMCAFIVLLFDMIAFLLFMSLTALLNIYKKHYIGKYGYPNNNNKIIQGDNETTVLQKYYGFSD